MSLFQHEDTLWVSNIKAIKLLTFSFSSFTSIVLGNTLSELHLEENKYLTKLAKANNALGDLKKRVSALQTTIATYSSHIQRINEKKRKLITDISENAKITSDNSLSPEPSHHSESGGNNTNMDTNQGWYISIY